LNCTNLFLHEEQKSLHDMPPFTERKASGRWVAPDSNGQSPFQCPWAGTNEHAWKIYVGALEMPLEKMGNHIPFSPTQAILTKITLF
jgi:hypothetical protein